MERWRWLGVEPVKIMRRRRRRKSGVLFLRGRSLCLKVLGHKEGRKCAGLQTKREPRQKQVERLAR